MHLNNITIIYDGNIHRFRVDGDKAGSKNGWYLAKPNGGVVYSSWKDGNARNYINKDGVHLNDQERMQFKKQPSIEIHVQQLKQRAEAEKLQSILEASTIGRHDYLAKKGFQNMQAQILGDALLVPIYDISRNFKRLISLQYIYRDGGKRFAKGCRAKGGMHMIATTGTEDTGVIYLCEGFATGLTLASATNSLVATCFYASNLIHACGILSRRLSEYRVIICSDNDRNTNGNPGITSAIDAAKKYKVDVITPDLSECSCKATDFNDIMLECSIEEVKRQLLSKPNYSLNIL